MSIVTFEIPGWRSLGDAKAEKTVEGAFTDAAAAARDFALNKGGRVLSKEVGPTITMEVPPAVINELEKEPFVARDYPDQVHSTLQVVAP